MMATQRLDQAQIDRAKTIIAHEQTREGATLPILHALQAAFGFIPDETVPMVADALNLSRAKVFGVVGFYHDFRRHPAGRSVVKLLPGRGLPVDGRRRPGRASAGPLGIAWHGTTPDGRRTLEPVYCLGLCATAPAAMVDGAVVGRLTPAGMDALLDAVR